MQGGHRARQQAGRRDTCRQQRTCRRHSPARSCPVEGHPPGDGPPWGSWAFREHRRLLASPGICPPASSCHLHALRNLLQRPLAPTCHHRRNSGPKPNSVSLLWCPSQHLQRKDPSSLCPDGQSGVSSLPVHACWAVPGPGTPGSDQGDTASPTWPLPQASSSTYFSDQGFSLHLHM